RSVPRRVARRVSRRRAGDRRPRLDAVPQRRRGDRPRRARAPGRKVPAVVLHDDRLPGGTRAPRALRRPDAHRSRRVDSTRLPAHAPRRRLDGHDGVRRHRRVGEGHAGGRRRAPDRRDGDRRARVGRGRRAHARPSGGWVGGRGAPARRPDDRRASAGRGPASALPSAGMRPCVLLLLAACAAGAKTMKTPADLVLVNGTVYTLDPLRPRADAVAVRDGRVAAVGTREDVTPLVGPATRVIDLGGRSVSPGLVDGHCHLYGLGKALEILSLRGLRSAKDAAAVVAKEAAARPAGEWIEGRGWGQNLWAPPAFPDRRGLYEVAPRP